ncbi:TetR/AcrR family transcriptional regulator [Dyella nitratireducens]|uniref:TetR family transcriptional regulator n=1 Tax=Dyella nitratireducens TaxID=1849580 RepID=A0ABQ1G4E0_9GAMM|nr:TetR/AcrR family transcriptional regulator [Dyella nitratireducens]GGA37307.1 TetR family transcriptional regulator [Dyella nitratireducens]GLQ41182.1 TetR family transcriptional regulator [Dyella nitratireducens]
MSPITTPTKGAATRELILDHAYELARQDGLEGLSIGALALGVGMSKSGVFAHFGSREELQLALLDAASKRLVDFVLRPAVQQPRGVKRLRAILEGWSEWVRIHYNGCVLISAVTEYDGREDSLLRARVKQQQTGWRNELMRAIRQAAEAGDLRADTDADQLAFEIFAVMLGLHHDASLFGFDQAHRQTWAAIDRLLASYQP